MSTHGQSERSFSIRFVRRLPCQVEFDKSILNKLQSKYSQMASAAKGVPSEKVSEIKLNLPPRRCCAALNALTTVYYGLLGPAAGRRQSNHSLKGSTAALVLTLPRTDSLAGSTSRRRRSSRRSCWRRTRTATRSRGTTRTWSPTSPRRRRRSAAPNARSCRRPSRTASRCTAPRALPSGPTNPNASALWAERCVPLRVYRPG